MRLDKEKYRAEIKRLYDEMGEAQVKIDKIEDYDEWCAADDANADKFLPRITELEKAVDLIERSSQPRSAYFIDFCKSLKNAQFLTQRQIVLFKQYAKEVTSCRYKTPVSQYSAIVDGKRYYIVGRQIYVEEVAQL